MKNCPKCGAMIEDGANFCNLCGALLKQSDSSAETGCGDQQKDQGSQMNDSGEEQASVSEQSAFARPSQQQAPVGPAGQPYRPCAPAPTPYNPQGTQPPKFNPYAIPGQQPVGFQPYPPVVQPGDPTKNGLAVAALVMGILALCFMIFCWGGVLFGTLGTIFGGVSLKSQKNGMAKAGLIMSIIALALTVLLFIFLFFVALADASYSTYSFTDYLRF